MVFKPKISAIILTQNESEMIEECIKSLSWTDEVIVFDSSSKDDTLSRAVKAGAKTISNVFDGFANARNKALKYATGDWVLFVDADERISDELRKEILAKIITSDYNAYSMPRTNYYLGIKWPQTEQVTRLFRKDCVKWYGELHESPRISGELGMLRTSLIHFTHRNLSEMVRKTNRWSEIEARLRFEAKHPKMKPWRFLRVMFTAFWKSYIGEKGYKAGTVGLIESMYQAFSAFITYSKLWEMQISAEKK